MADSTKPPDTTTTGEIPKPDQPSQPTFLSSDPYPSHPDGRPTSSTSALTDATSEFGDYDFTSAKEHQSTIPSLTGPAGESALPPSRPTSSVAASSQGTATNSRYSMQPPSSRRGLAPSWGRHGSDSRPGTGNKTHVPTLTAQGFFRPLSSQKLQAQRNPQRPGSALAQSVTSAERLSQDNQTTRSRRYSDASVNTLRDAQRATKESANADDAPPLPVSRGTEFTSESKPNAAPSVTSATPLHQQARPNSKNNKKLGNQLDAIRTSNTPSNSSQPQKSPRSFRASLGLGSRTSKQEPIRPSPSPQHEKLDSNPSSPNYAEKPPLPSSQPTKDASHGKNYQYFAGNMLFALGGRFLNTRAQPLNIATFVLTILPAALFFAFSAPWLWHNLSPAIPILFGYVFYISISSFLHAALSDPGILPRNMHPHPSNPAEERDPLTVGPAATEWVMVGTFANQPKQASQAEQGRPATAMEVPTKYCKSCNIWRPPRAHHCRVCDCCIETQDHHCVWLNNCVGRRNYRFFFTYVASASVLALMLLAFSLAHVGLYGQRQGIGFGVALTGRTEERVAFGMFVYSVLALPYPGSLFVYHLFLIARGETTREYLNSHKFLKKDRHRPFTQASMVRNWVSVLVRPRPPTYMQFKRGYVPGDIRFGHTVPKRERKKELKNRYSVQGQQGTNGNAGVEMKELGGQKPQIKSAGGGPGGGGLSGPVDRTPR